MEVFLYPFAGAAQSHTEKRPKWVFTGHKINMESHDLGVSESVSATNYLSDPE